MTDEEKTREQLIEELNSLRKDLSELKGRLDFVERFNKVAFNREFRIKELKDENEELKGGIEEMKGR